MEVKKIGMKIEICVPSYRRPKVKTLQYVPWAKVYVDEGEAEQYRAANAGANIIAVRHGIQGNLCRIRNYILDTEFSAGADGVVILDDDYKDIGVWQGEKGGTLKRVKIETGDLMAWLEKYFTLCEEWGFKMWGLNVSDDRMNYSETAPFSTVSYLGGPFQAFLPNPLRYDERLPLKEDYDMTLQHLLKYRGVMKLNFASYVVEQCSNVGGCATYRNMEREKEQFEALQRKWGSKIVKTNKGRSSKSKKRQEYYINPSLSIPIKGV